MRPLKGDCVGLGSGPGGDTLTSTDRRRGKPGADGRNKSKGRTRCDGISGEIYNDQNLRDSTTEKKNLLLGRTGHQSSKTWDASQEKGRPWRFPRNGGKTKLSPNRG